MLKLKNTQPGPRGVNAVSGPVLVDPGQSVEVAVYEREKEHLEASGWFEIKGSYTANPGAAAKSASATDGELAARAAEIEKVFAEREKTSKEEIEARDAEIAELRKQLEAKGGSPVLKAEHHGGGRFNVTEGETVHLSGLSKADADAFNAMTDADKKAYVEASKQG